MKPHVFIQGILDMHAVDVDDNKCCPINDWLPKSAPRSPTLTNDLQTLRLNLKSRLGE